RARSGRWVPGRAARQAWSLSWSSSGVLDVVAGAGCARAGAAAGPGGDAAVSAACSTSITDSLRNLAARRWPPSAPPRPPWVGGFASTGSGGRRGPVAAGCPCPVDKHAQGGTHNCGPHSDQGDQPARHVAGAAAAEGVGQGPESDELGGRDCRRVHPGARERGGGGPHRPRPGEGQPRQRGGRGGGWGGGEPEERPSGACVFGL